MKKTLRLSWLIAAFTLVLGAAPAHAMVYVNSIKDLTDNAKTRHDFTFLSHVKYALEVTGGKLVDKTTGIAGIKEDENLHIVDHGDKGSLQDIAIADLANVFKQLPKGYKGRIIVTPCFSSGVVANGKTTLRQIADALKGHAKTTLIGNKGPSITNIHMSPKIAYVPEAKVGSAGTIQTDMLTKGTYASLVKDWNKKADDLHTAHKTAEEMVTEAAVFSKDFYQAFHDKLAHDNLLAPEHDMLTSIDVM